MVRGELEGARGEVVRCGLLAAGGEVRIVRMISFTFLRRCEKLVIDCCSCCRSLLLLLFRLAGLACRCAAHAVLSCCAALVSRSSAGTLQLQSRPHLIMLRSVVACALAGAVAVNAIATISAKGSKFFTSDGDQFYVKGMQSPGGWSAVHD